jgi:hypothetical protein
MNNYILFTPPNAERYLSTVNFEIKLPCLSAI